MNALIQQQLDFNSATRASWSVFHAQRDRVTALLQKAGGDHASRLCILGAGNCNDLELPALLAGHREVHLVDLDRGALADGVRRQGVETHPSLRCHGDVDVTGVLAQLARWSPHTGIAEDELAACAAAPVQHVRPVLPGPFDLVASTCLLTQLLGFIVLTLGERHPQFLHALQAVRAGHLRLLVDLVAPGGTGVFVCDLVSSDSYPPLTSISEDQLPGVLRQLVYERNFFHGVNPAVVAALLQTDPVLAPQVTDLECVRPWLWDLGPRVYLVYACTFRKAHDRGG